MCTYENDNMYPVCKENKLLNGFSGISSQPCCVNVCQQDKPLKYHAINTTYEA